MHAAQQAPLQVVHPVWNRINVAQSWLWPRIFLERVQKILYSLPGLVCRFFTWAWQNLRGGWTCCVRSHSYGKVALYLNVVCLLLGLNLIMWLLVWTQLEPFNCGKFLWHQCQTCQIYLSSTDSKWLGDTFLIFVNTVWTVAESYQSSVPSPRSKYQIIKGCASFTRPFWPSSANDTIRDSGTVWLLQHNYK